MSFSYKNETSKLTHMQISNGVNLMMHISPEKLPQVLKLLPKTKLPRIKKIAGENWYNVLTFCTKKEARRLIPQLKMIGCEDIVEFSAIC